MPGALHMTSCIAYHMILTASTYDIMYSILCDPRSILLFHRWEKSFRKVNYLVQSDTLLTNKNRVLNPDPCTQQSLSLSLCCGRSLESLWFCLYKFRWENSEGLVFPKWKPSQTIKFLVWSPLTWDSPKCGLKFKFALDSFRYFFITNSINYFINSIVHFIPLCFLKRELMQWL